MALCNGAGGGGVTPQAFSINKSRTLPDAGKAPSWYWQNVLARPVLMLAKRHNDYRILNFLLQRRVIELRNLQDYEGSYAAASTVIGTPYYMSPEVCQGQSYGYMSDVWALARMEYLVLILIGAL